MKTISIETNSITSDLRDPRDDLFTPSKEFKRTMIMNADGLHFYSQLPDGQTTTHTFVPMAELHALVERHEPRFKRPAKPLTAKPVSG